LGVKAVVQYRGGEKDSAKRSPSLRIGSLIESVVLTWRLLYHGRVNGFDRAARAAGLTELNVEAECG